MDSTETSILIPPYGGQLINLLVQSEEMEDLKAYANALPSLVLSDRGIVWNDPDPGTAWPVDEPVLSSKDSELPGLKDAENNFIHEEMAR